MSRTFLFLTASLCAAATLAASQGLEQHATFKGGELAVVNLVGKIRVEPAEGSSFDVDVIVRGRDAAPGIITFERTDGEKATFAIRFPVEKHPRYVYPEMGTDFESRVDVPDAKAVGHGLLDLVLPGVHDRVRIASEGSGLQIWADVTVKMPRDGRLEIRHGVGSIEAEGTAGALLLDSHYGPITVARAEGRLAIDTGSGDARVSDSGGDIAIDTGSGSVDLIHCRATVLKVDTGSGSVRADEIECDGMSVDTGSGDVSISLKRMGSGDFLIDTGSGSVDFRIPAGAQARFAADAGSGGIDVALPGVEIHRDSADDLVFRTGEGGASVRIDTGSGSIRVGTAAL